MPSITPTVRASIGGSPEDFRQPRASVTASTGMGLPSRTADAVPTAPPEKSGQLNTPEETVPSAVTLSPQLTALARKQQKLQSEIQAQRDREAAFAAKEADYLPKSAFKAKLQQNAAEALSELGVNYEELTQLLLAQTQGDDPVKALQAEIQQIKQAQEQNVSKQYDATVAQYRKEIESLVKADDNFVTVREEGAQDAVLQHILDTFKEDGEILTVEDASKEIEEFLVTEAEKKLNLTKLKAKLAPPPAQKPAEKTLPPPRSGTRTLTQQVEATPTRIHNQFQHLSMKERIEQSIARARK